MYRGGYKTFEEEIAVQRGMKTTLKIRLEPGESAPPGTKPGDKGSEKKDDEKHER